MLPSRRAWGAALAVVLALIVIPLAVTEAAAAESAAGAGQEESGAGGQDEPGAGDEGNGPMDWADLALVALFGALGGVVYELIALQGNVEWPHKTKKEELPEAGYGYAKFGHLFDLGIVARLVIGAAAAVVVFWVLPREHLVAVSIVAGSAGTAVFRSLQDRMLAALNGAKVENLAAGIESLDESLESVSRQAAAVSATGAPASAAADLTAKAAELRGQVRALLKIAGRQS